MVKKLQKMADKKKAAAATGFPAGLLDSEMAQHIKDSAQQIWAAGLASFAKAQGEGSKVFEALVSEGLKLQKKTQSAAEEKLSAVASKVSGVAGDVGAKAGQHWDKLEAIFEQRVAKALQGLGVPTKADIDSLIERIDALAQATGVQVPAKKAPAARKPAAPAKKAAAAKPAAKAPARKAVTPAPAKKAAAARKTPAAKKAAAPAAQA
jgi:poly(hydroxyalkanoate) granule-associated protein